MTLKELIEKIKNMVVGENRVTDFTELSVNVTDLIPELNNIDITQAEEIGARDNRITQLESDVAERDRTIADLREDNRKMVERYGRAVVDGQIEIDKRKKEESGNTDEKIEFEEFIKKF